VAGGFVAILNQTAMATAVPHIMQTFDLTENTAQWLTTIFMLINGVMIPITAFLIETFTTRQLFFTAMSVFFGGTVMCALAPGFPFLIVGRVVQAAGAGIILPLTMTVIFRVFPPHRRGFAMGTVGLVIAFAPALGPTISGWIVENHSWRTIFIVMLPIALLDIAAAHRYLKNVTYQTYPRVDILSILLSVVGFGGLLYGFSSAGNIGWDHARVVIALGAGALTLLVFILRQLRLPEPILEFRVFQNRTFTIATVITVLAFMAMISAETILPIYMQNMAGFTALQSGQVIMPGALLMGMMSPIAGRIFDRIGARILALTGLTIVTVTTLFFTRLSPDTGLQGITVFFALRMFGVSMVMMPVTTAGLNALRSDLIPHGTAMNNTMRQVGASIGTGTLVTVMTLTALDTGPQAPAAARIHGVNVAFAVTAFLSLAAFALAFFLPGAKQSSAARASSE
jgi:EmrB/QacA subfamily drug resistance transporter